MWEIHKSGSGRGIETPLINNGNLRKGVILCLLDKQKSHFLKTYGKEEFHRFFVSISEQVGQ